MNAPLPDPSIGLRPLCLSCGHHTLEVQGWAEVRHRIVVDLLENGLRVVGEELGDVVWEVQSPVRCRRCGWQGVLADVPL